MSEYARHHVRARWGTAILFAITVAVPGCRWLREGGVGVGAQMAVPEPSPEPTPEAIAGDETLELQQEAGEARSGNPEEWGDAARLTVGREFDPVYFDAMSAELNLSARRTLSEHVDWLRAHPYVWVTLAGYCEPGPGVEYAYNLAMARALAVEDYMVGMGLEVRRLFPIGYGFSENTAVDSTTQRDPDQSSALDARVEILGFVAPAGQLTPVTRAATDEKTPPETTPRRPGASEDLPTG